VQRRKRVVGVNNMYFYKRGDEVLRKLGGEPPSDEYVALDPKGVLRHIKNNEIIDEKNMQFIFPDDVDLKDTDLYKQGAMTVPEIRELYTTVMANKVAKKMLIPSYNYRKKKSVKPKATRKVKVVKKCKCK
jgi:hypothetical protein